MLKLKKGPLIQRLKAKLRGRRAYLPAVRYPDDTYLVSYPKSGNTWLRFLVANYVSGNTVTFENLGEYAPDLHGTNPKQVDTARRPRFIKSHAPHVPQYRRVVYIVRDGRDVAVSYYFHLLKWGLLPRETPFEEYLEKFHRGEVGFGSWSRHVHSWLDHPPREFLLLRYEEMKQDAASALRRTLELARIPVDEERVRAAVEASRFERLREMENEQHDRLDWLAVTDPNIPFFRSGTVGDSRRHFTPQQMERFVAVHGSALRRLGYLP